MRLQNQKHKYWLHLMLQWVSHVIACLEWWVLRNKFFHGMPLALCCKGCLISIATLSWSRLMWKVALITSWSAENNIENKETECFGGLLFEGRDSSHPLLHLMSTFYEEHVKLRRIKIEKVRVRKRKLR